MSVRSDETSSEDLFEDAVDTFTPSVSCTTTPRETKNSLVPQNSNLPAASGVISVKVPFGYHSCSANQLRNKKSPPIDPPPPLPSHLVTSPSLCDTSMSSSIPQSPTSLEFNPLVVSSPIIPPPLPPRRPQPKNPEPPFSASTSSGAVTPLNNGVQTPEMLRSPDQSYGRQRGHAKTNSLDRGLSLAKCMKTGPFPPPTAGSKSNSLTRGASPSDLLPILDEQDQSASTVIQGVIQQVLSEKNSLVDEDEIPMDKEKETRDNEKMLARHDSGSLDIAQVNETDKPSFAKTEEKPSQKANSHYENLADPPQSPPIPPKALIAVSSKQSISNSSPNSAKKINLFGEKQHRRSASDKSPAKVKTSCQHKCSTWEPNGQPKLSHQQDLMDPITRDVERRISLRERNSQTAKQTVANDSADDDDDVFDTHQHKGGSFDHIRRFARSYGASATDFLRGAVRIARQQAEYMSRKSEKNASEIVGDDDGRNDEASSVADSDMDQLSIAASVSLAPPMPVDRNKRATSSAEPHSSPSVASPVARTGICRPKNAKKGPFDFEQLMLVQELNHEHTGAIWCIKFSDCGRLLATAGQDRNVRVWVIRSQLNLFTSLRERYGQEAGGSANLDYSTIGNLTRAEIYDLEEDDRSSRNMESGIGGIATSHRSTTGMPSSSSSSPVPQSSANLEKGSSGKGSPVKTAKAPNPPTACAVSIFSPKPFCVFRGHTADVLDLSWSPRNYFLLSGGMDRTAKLWHLTRGECLCSFQHIDFVTCLAFMPKDDRYFISGSLDGKIRLWHIPEKKVAIWNEVEQVNKYITAMTFVKNGKFVVVGTFQGRCFFYSSDQLKYHTVIDVRSSRGKNSTGHKITSLAVHGDKLLVTSNDSRIRIYDLRDMDLCCKFKGAQICQSLVRAAFSPDGSHIISGSEDSYIYLWRTNVLPSSLAVRKDRNHAWERVRAHPSGVITAIFAPKPHLILNFLVDQLKWQKGLTEIDSPTTSTLFPRSKVAWPPKSAREQRNPPKTAGTEDVLANAKKKLLSSSAADRSSLAISGRLALPTANLTELNQHPNKKISTASLGYVSSAMSSTGDLPTAGTSGVTKDRRRALGDVIVSADLTGSLKVFVNVTRMQAGTSNFFPY